MFFKYNIPKQFYQTAPRNCHGLKLSKCWLQFKRKIYRVIYYNFRTPLFPTVTNSRISHTHTHTHNRLTAFGSDYRVGQYQKKHSPTHTHPDHRTSYYDPQHPRCSVYVHDSPLGQPLSRSSLVFLLVLDPLLHTPYISSPNHHVFAAHAHTNAASSAVRTKVQDITQQR